jgi:Ca2+-transporting ATPase
VNCRLTRLVPGDLILLEAGDRIPADGYLIESNELQADESLVTGESMPVMKKALPEGDGSSAKKKNHGAAYAYIWAVRWRGEPERPLLPEQEWKRRWAGSPT